MILDNPTVFTLLYISIDQQYVCCNKGRRFYDASI